MNYEKNIIRNDYTRNSNDNNRVDITMKDKVITELLSRIATLEWEVERLESTLNQVDKYIEKMSYSSIVDNPKKDLQKILKRSDKE